MLIARIQSAVLIIFVLPAFFGCSRSPHTYSIYTVTINNPAGNIVMISFSEVPHAAACGVTAKAADKGIAEANPEAGTSGRAAVCVSELPPDLQRVAGGERLPGAYIVKILWPPASPTYSITRGFPIDRPDAICRSLTERMKEHLHANDATITCQYPLEVASTP